MATSSIFHNIVINDEATAERFVAALEASEAHPLRGTGRPIEEVLASKDEIDRWIKLWEKKHGEHKQTGTFISPTISVFSAVDAISGVLAEKVPDDID